MQKIFKFFLDDVTIMIALELIIQVEKLIPIRFN